LNRKTLDAYQHLTDRKPTGKKGDLMMSGLAVKVDQVAALRAVRKSQIPDPVTAASVAELAGADGIIVHLYQNFTCTRTAGILKIEMSASCAV
jgi:hypothetical protein